MCIEFIVFPAFHLIHLSMCLIRVFYVCVCVLAQLAGKFARVRRGSKFNVQEVGCCTRMELDGNRTPSVRDSPSRIATRIVSVYFFCLKVLRNVSFSIWKNFQYQLNLDDLNVSIVLCIK